MDELARIELAARRVAEFCFTAIEPTTAKQAFLTFANELHAIQKRREEKSAR